MKNSSWTVKDQKLISTTIKLRQKQYNRNSFTKPVKLLKYEINKVCNNTKGN